MGFNLAFKGLKECKCAPHAANIIILKLACVCVCVLEVGNPLTS